MGKHAEITPDAWFRIPTLGAELVADDPNAIGYISMGLVDPRVKALEVDGVGPPGRMSRIIITSWCGGSYWWPRNSSPTLPGFLSISS